MGSLFDGTELQTGPAGTILFMPEDSSERLCILEQGRGGLMVTGLKRIQIIDRHSLNEIVVGEQAGQGVTRPIKDDGFG